jgi:UDP-glucose 4-epimerase
MLDRPSVAVPYTLGRAVLQRLWQLRLTTSPVPELDHIRFVCMVDDQRARRVLGFKPAHGIEETVRAVDEGVW